MKKIFISAPYGDKDPKIRQINTRKARALARLAVETGGAPVYVHDDIAAGVYGDDRVPRDRERGLHICRFLCDDSDGVFELVPRTPGMRYETKNKAVFEIKSGTWAEWEEAFQERGLIEVYLAATAEGPS